MYTSFYAMSFNPFIKEETYKYPFKSNDYNEVLNRLNYIKEIKGIGLFYGENGVGKTYTIRSFVNSLNKDLYKVIYVNITINLSTFELLNILSKELSLSTGACYKTDLISNIQNEIVRIVKEDKMNVVIVLDDVHLLTRNTLLDLKILYDFDIGSKDYVTLILVGREEIKVELTKTIHESLSQRINVNYKFNGLERNEVKEYIQTRLELANTDKDIFEIEALNSLYLCSNSSIRMLNKIVNNCLMLGSQNKKTIIDNEIVMLAKGESDLR